MLFAGCPTEVWSRCIPLEVTNPLSSPWGDEYYEMVIAEGYEVLWIDNPHSSGVNLA